MNITRFVALQFEDRPALITSDSESLLWIDQSPDGTFTLNDANTSVPVGGDEDAEQIAIDWLTATGPAIDPGVVRVQGLPLEVVTCGECDAPVCISAQGDSEGHYADCAAAEADLGVVDLR